MNNVVSRIKNEPAMVGTLVEAFIAMAFAFSWINWTGEQVGTVMGLVALVTGLFVRQSVYPAHRVETEEPAAAARLGAPPGN